MLKLQNISSSLSRIKVVLCIGENEKVLYNTFPTFHLRPIYEIKKVSDFSLAVKHFPFTTYHFSSDVPLLTLIVLFYSLHLISFVQTYATC